MAVLTAVVGIGGVGVVVVVGDGAAGMAAGGHGGNVLRLGFGTAQPGPPRVTPRPGTDPAAASVDPGTGGSRLELS